MDVSKEVLNDCIATLKMMFGIHYLLNDPAHRTEHFHYVFFTGCHLNKVVKTPYHTLAVLLVAYLHDLFAWSRENHHELSHLFVVGTENKHIVEMMNMIAAENKNGWDLEETRRQIAMACLQHRASFKGEFYSEFCELMNSADIGAPETVERTILRSLKYSLSKFPTLTEEEHYERVASHMEEKFSSKGYLRLPALYMKCFATEVADFQRAMDSVKAIDVKRVHYGFSKGY